MVAVFLLALCGSPASRLRQLPTSARCTSIFRPVAPANDAGKSGAAPADVAFGIYPMSVLGIQNTLRRDGEAIDDGADRSALTTGPLACVVDSLRGWERAYPGDPWIAKDLLTLEFVYLRARAGDASDLAAQTEAWLEHDYPASNYVEPARLALGNTRDSSPKVGVAPPVTFASAPVAPVVAVAPVAAVAPIAEFIAPPILLAAAPAPMPVAAADSFPALKLPVSPWDRFAPLVTNRK